MMRKPAKVATTTATRKANPQVEKSETGPTNANPDATPVPTVADSTRPGEGASEPAADAATLEQLGEVSTFQGAMDLIQMAANAARTGETLIAALRDHIPDTLVTGMASTKARRLRALLEKHDVPLPTTEGLADAQRIVQLLDGTFSPELNFTKQPVNVSAEVVNLQKMLNIKFSGKWRRLATELRPLIQGFEESAIPSVAGPTGQVHAFQFFLADEAIPAYHATVVQAGGIDKVQPILEDFVVDFLKVLIPESQRSLLRQQFDQTLQKKNQTPNQYAAELKQLVEVLDPLITEQMAVEKFVDTCVANEHVYFQLQAQHRSGQDGMKFRTLTAAAEAAAQAACAHARLQTARQNLASAGGEGDPDVDNKGQNGKPGTNKRMDRTNGGFKRKKPEGNGQGSNKDGKGQRPLA